MVKYNFSFTDEEVRLLFSAFVLFRHECRHDEIASEIDDFIEKHEIFDIVANLEDSDGC